MKIYVSHSRDFDFRNELYEPLKSSLKSIEFIFPHEDSDKPFNTKELFENKTCDLVLAEVSRPSTGQGIELGWANLLNIPILCVFKTNSDISGSLSVLTDELIEYNSSEDLISKLVKFFSK